MENKKYLKSIMQNMKLLIRHIFIKSSVNHPGGGVNTERVMGAKWCDSPLTSSDFPCSSTCLALNFHNF